MPDKEQKKFKVDAYLDWFEFEIFEATKQLGDFQRSDKMLEIIAAMKYLKPELCNFFVNFDMPVIARESSSAAILMITGRNYLAPLIMTDQITQFRW